MIDYLPMIAISYSLQLKTEKNKKKTVISISILIHIYIEMNPDANERNGMYLKTGPLAALRHQQASPRGISKSIKHANQMLSSIPVQVRRGKQGKTSEHNKVLTRELMSCLGNP